MQAYMPEKCIFRAFLLLFAFVFGHEHGNTSLCSALLFIDLTYRIGHFLCEFAPVQSVEFLLPYRSYSEQQYPYKYLLQADWSKSVLLRRRPSVCSAHLPNESPHTDTATPPDHCPPDDSFLRTCNQPTAMPLHHPWPEILTISMRTGSFEFYRVQRYGKILIYAIFFLIFSVFL